MRILTLQNFPSTPLGQVGDTIERLGGELAVKHVYKDDPVPREIDGYDGLIVLGGAQSAAAVDDHKNPTFGPIMQLIRDFHAADRPVLGICLGHQLVARAFDAPVHRLSGFEFGYSPLETTEAGKTDPLVGGLATPHRMMQWHEDSAGLPADAVHLVRGDKTPNQGFRLGRATYAFQGHFEATPEILAIWIKGSVSPKRHYGDRVEREYQRVRDEIARHAASARRFAETVTERWLALARR
jgi:GMP synthase-like glutamine amidotransferase